MSWLRDRWWLGWLLSALLLAGGVYAWLHRPDHAEAERLEAVAESATAEADSAWNRTQVLKDSLEEERAEKEAFRDSVQELRVIVRRQAEDAEEDFQLSTPKLHTQIAELRRAVRPELREAVDSIRATVDRRTEAHDRYRESMVRTVTLLQLEKASLEAEKDDAWSVADSLEAGWAKERSAHADTRAAMEQWKDDAKSGPLEAFFGEGVLEVIGTAGSAWLAWEVGGEKGLAGWGLAKGTDVVLSARSASWRPPAASAWPVPGPRAPAGRPAIARP